MSAPKPPYSGLTLRSAKRFMARQFADAGLPFAEEDALDLLLGLLGISHTHYVIHGSDCLCAEQLDAITTACERRLAGKPVDRILGWRDFYGRRFNIDKVLSPRGDTEILLLAALAAVKDTTDPTLIDLGTGSGALAVTLLCERPDARVTATDIDPDALMTARRNANAHGVLDRINLRQSNWFNAVPLNPLYDAVLSNPPYITSDAMAALSPEVADHDPDRALHGGIDGLAPYRILIPGARAYLRADGWLGVEIGYDQGEAVQDLFAASGYRNIRCLPDPAGLDRVVCGQV